MSRHHAAALVIGRRAQGRGERLVTHDGAPASTVLEGTVARTDGPTVGQGAWAAAGGRARRPSGPRGRGVQLGGRGRPLRPPAPWRPEEGQPPPRRAACRSRRRAPKSGAPLPRRQGRRDTRSRETPDTQNSNGAGHDPEDLERVLDHEPGLRGPGDDVMEPGPVRDAYPHLELCHVALRTVTRVIRGRSPRHLSCPAPATRSCTGDST